MRKGEYGEALSNDQIEHFLEESSVGTLAIGTNGDSPPYNIPMTFGYNVTHQPVFQFINHPDSEKMKYVTEGTDATLTVLDKRSGGWVSVMVRGELRKVDSDRVSWAEAVFKNHTPDETVNMFVEREDYHTEYWTLESVHKSGRWSGNHSFNVKK